MCICNLTHTAASCTWETVSIDDNSATFNLHLTPDCGIPPNYNIVLFQRINCSGDPFRPSGWSSLEFHDMNGDWVPQISFENLNPCTRYDFFVKVLCNGVLTHECYTQSPISTTGCATSPCCSVIPTLRINETSCSEVEICIDGYTGCADTWFKYHGYNHVTGENLHSGPFTANNCYTFSGIDQDDMYEFTVIVGLPDGCYQDPADLTEFYSRLFKISDNCLPSPCEHIELAHEGIGRLGISLAGSCENSGVISFEFAYKEPGGVWVYGIPGNINANVPNLLIQGLASCTTYEVKVRVRCGTDYMDWCYLTGTTKGCSPTPHEDGPITQDGLPVIVQVSPNPASNFATISIKSDIRSNAEIAIIDGTGSIQYSFNQELYSGNNNFRLDDLRRLSPGVYYYRVFANNEIVSGKLLIQ